jgi:hypothetical protein
MGFKIDAKSARRTDPLPPHIDHDSLTPPSSVDCVESVQSVERVKHPPSPDSVTVTANLVSLGIVESGNFGDVDSIAANSESSHANVKAPAASSIDKPAIEKSVPIKNPAPLDDSSWDLDFLLARIKTGIAPVGRLKEQTKMGMYLERAGWEELK